MNETPPVHWYQSQRFTALWQSAALLALGFLVYAFQTNDWNSWREMLVIPLLSNAILILREWFKPDVIAPVSALNRNNVAPGDPKP